jgi:hypothetical protein
VTDPIYGHDIAFYVFRLPSTSWCVSRRSSCVSSRSSAAASTTSFSGSFVIEAQPKVSAWPRIRLVPIARRHLSVLTALVLGLMAWGAWLEVPTTPHHPDAGQRCLRRFVQRHLRAHPVHLDDVWRADSRRRSRAPAWLQPPELALARPPSCSTSWWRARRDLRQLHPAAGRHPDEQNKELPYIKHNIDATGRAYSLDRVEERDLSGDGTLELKDVIANAATIENVRLWDHEPLKQTFASNPGDSAVLRLYRGRQRPLHDRRPVPAS